LGGLYDGLHGGYGGDFENVKSIDGGYDVGAYKVEPLVAPPLLDAGYHASHSPHFHGRGHSHLPHPHAFARVPVGKYSFELISEPKQLELDVRFLKYRDSL